MAWAYRSTRMRKHMATRGGLCNCITKDKINMTGWKKRHVQWRITMTSTWLLKHFSKASSSPSSLSTVVSSSTHRTSEQHLQKLQKLDPAEIYFIRSIESIESGSPGPFHFKFNIDLSTLLLPSLLHSSSQSPTLLTGWDDMIIIIIIYQLPRTVVSNCMKSTHSFHRQKPLSHELRSEWVSERVNEWAQRSARAKQAVRSKRMSERCERTSERRSEWPNTLRVDLLSFETTVPRPPALRSPHAGWSWPKPSSFILPLYEFVFSA